MLLQRHAPGVIATRTHAQHAGVRVAARNAAARARSSVASRSSPQQQLEQATCDIADEPAVPQSPSASIDLATPSVVPLSSGEFESFLASNQLVLVDYFTQ
jgi:hypothetical protein